MMIFGRRPLTRFDCLHRVRALDSYNLRSYTGHISQKPDSEIFPDVEYKCDKCQGSPCYLSHMFFLCPNLRNFWSGYFAIITAVLKVNVQTCPLIAIFGVPNPSLPLTTAQKDIIAFTSLLARRWLLLHWKSIKFPSVSQQLNYVMFFFK